jgi:sialate O-acetylesterase
MISPLRNMKFQGVLWYQGESNVERRNEYADLLIDMIKDWRGTFHDFDLPFYIVELAEFLHKSDEQGRQAWEEMRQVQAKAAKKATHAKLIKNEDLGEWNDIHPLNKKTLGKRIAKAAIKDIR